MSIASYDMLDESMKDVLSDSLIRLIYISGLNTTSDSVFKHIQSHSESFNKDNNIAGFLCNNDQSFLQCLEGTKDVVSSLMQRIFKDENHKDVAVVFAKKVSGYSFTDWRMHSLNLDNDNWEKFSNHTKVSDISPFKPQHWPSWFIEHFIETVKKIDYSDINQSYITFDTLGYSAIKKKLARDNVLFYIFLGLLICSATVILLFRHDVIF
ncbi:BLUF domain-containing protein [Psychrobacter sp. TAE2020]|uniref:BLUF domain-containing protein n=1 Tax=Psychrobacter sp. TAE2020 TaxID=2846762 RepID=UPI001C10E745|nr:BLUF domain-containing protein [Psychrobacter sp. TAE2020]MBU5617272.1 BLUF domain-containing protein [Psychrobacter sp. TAE2020]